MAVKHMLNMLGYHSQDSHLYRSHLASQQRSWQLGKAFRISAMVCNDLLTESFPVLAENLHRMLALSLSEAAVLNTPFRELLPAVDRHARIPNHDLIEFVRE